MKNFLNLLCHELRLQVMQKTEWASLLLFFVIVVILMPFALGPEPEILRRLAPGLIWLAALLMVLLSLDRLFVQDVRDGTLDLMLTSAVALEIILLAKLGAQILVVLVMLVAMVPFAAMLLGLPLAVLPVLIASFALGVPSLVLIGGIGGAVTVALNRNAALLTLLLIPFYIPVLIFAVSACDAAAIGQSAAQPLLFLTAILALILPASPFIIAMSLRHGQG
jgi:heme exporter protein B